MRSRKLHESLLDESVMLGVECWFCRSCFCRCSLCFVWQVLIVLVWGDGAGLLVFFCKLIDVMMYFQGNNREIDQEIVEVVDAYKGRRS